MAALAGPVALAALAAGLRADPGLAGAHPVQVLWQTAGFQLTNPSSMQTWPREDGALAEAPLEGAAAQAEPEAMALFPAPDSALVRPLETSPVALAHL